MKQVVSIRHIVFDRTYGTRIVVQSGATEKHNATIPIRQMYAPLQREVYLVVAPGSQEQREFHRPPLASAWQDSTWWYVFDW